MLFIRVVLDHFLSSFLMLDAGPLRGPVENERD